jgi:hypothetical protein
LIANSAKLLGELALVDLKLAVYKPDEMMWLSPWAGQVEKTKIALAESRAALTSMVQGLPDPKGFKAAEASIAEARKLDLLLAPVLQSVMTAQHELA